MTPESVRCDPDPQYWGHSFGWYENDDTLVVDTIGVNDRPWLDQLGHPRTEKLHFIERYKKADDKTIELDNDDRRSRRVYEAVAGPPESHPVGNGIHALSMGLFGA